MAKNTKVEMRKRARALEGLLNLLKDDVDQLRIDSADFDVICLEESILHCLTLVCQLCSTVVPVSML